MKKEETVTQPATNGTGNQSLEVRKPATELQIEQVGVQNIDSLETAEASPINLMSDYWSPENAGEVKRVIFDRIDISPVLSQETGEILDLETAFFFVKENGTVKQLRNGSKRLVGALQAYNVQRGTPLEIRYLGKKQNRMNAFKSDNWSVTPLIVKTTAK